jgi:hypothetical protein
MEEDFQGVVNFLKRWGGREINRVWVDTLGPPRMDVTSRPTGHRPAAGCSPLEAIQPLFPNFGDEAAACTRNGTRSGLPVIWKVLSLEALQKSCLAQDALDENRWKRGIELSRCF